MMLFGTRSVRKSASSGVAARWINVPTPPSARATAATSDRLPTTSSATPDEAIQFVSDMTRRQGAGAERARGGVDGWEDLDRVAVARSPNAAASSPR